MLLYELLTESIDLNSKSEQEQIAAVQQDGLAIEYIKNPSEVVQLAAIRQNGLVLKYIQHPSDAIKLAAVQQNGHAIRYIQNPSEAVQLAAVKRIGFAIKYIPNPSKSLQLAAVRQNGSAIEYIETPSKAVQLAAVQQSGYAIQYIKNPSQAVQLAAVQRNGSAIHYIKNPSEALQLAAVKQDGVAINYIRPSSETVQLVAVSSHSSSIQCIPNPSEAVQLAAVKQDGLTIQFIETPSEAVQLAAVKQNAYAIKHIKNPSEVVQRAAANQAKDRVISQYNISDKDSALIELLTFIKGNELENHMILYYVLRHTYPKWPEWAAIDKSLRASKLIKESNPIKNINKASEAEQIAYVQQDSDRIQYITNPSESVQLAAVQRSSSLPRPDNHPISEADAPIGDPIWQSRTKTCLNIYKWHHIWHLINDMAENDWELRYMPELNNLFEQEKGAIIAEILKTFKNGHPGASLVLISRLQLIGINWPELDIIRNSAEKVARSTNSSSLVENALRHTETAETVPYPAGYVINHIRGQRTVGGASPIYQGILKMHDAGLQYIEIVDALTPYAEEIASYWDYSINQPDGKNRAKVGQFLLLIELGARWPIIVPTLDKNKDILIWYFLSAMKESLHYAIPGNGPKERLLSHIQNIRQLGIAWPELDIIAKSVSGIQESNQTDVRASAIRSNVNQASEEEQIAWIKISVDAARIQYIENPSEAVQLAAVKQNGYAIRYIKNPSKAVQLVAVQKNGSAIRFIKNPSAAVQLAAVKQDGYAIKHIENPSEAVQLAAVQQDGLAISYIPNPSEAVQLAAVQRWPSVIEYIHNPSEAVQLAAVQQNRWSIKYIKNPTRLNHPNIKSLILTPILQWIKYDELDLNVYNRYQQVYPDWPEWAAIDKSLRASKLINEGVELNLYREDEQIFAVRKNPTDIIFIKNPSEAVQFAAVMKDVGALLAIKNPTDNVVLYAIKKDPHSIDYVKHPSKNMILTSILAQIKNYRGNYFEPKVYIKYKELHPEWDEWKVIDKSLDQLGLYQQLNNRL